MKIRHFYIICLLLFFVGLAHGQSINKPRKKLAKQTKKSTAGQKKVRTISLGVLNGRAIDLKVPKYPKAAKAVNVYGQVTVAVLIGETGKVVWANAKKGHPLLRTAAETAALRSTFWTTLLSGVPVRVNGVIVYNFTLLSWNWLEIGYALGGGNSYYSIKSLASQFPVGYADESRLLTQKADAGTLIAIIQSKLSGDSRSKWLFDLGLVISKLRSTSRRDDTELKAIGLEASNFYLSAPSNVSPILLNHLKRLTYIIHNPDEEKYDPIRGNEVYQLVSKMEDQFPFIGR